MEQGSLEWLALRKTKITATDAPIIMGECPWKDPLTLYREKKDPEFFSEPNERMKRGTELEPVARFYFVLDSGIMVEPRIVVKDWAMASLDGMSPCGKYIVEIKCPSKKYHYMAKKGVLPSHYIGQLQHQMWVCDIDSMYYYSFDGLEGISVHVVRNPYYVNMLIQREEIFYDCLIRGDEEKIKRVFTPSLLNSICHTNNTF